MNTRIYLVEFDDGHVAEYGANAIAEAIYNQVDDCGFSESLFTDIIGHRKIEEAARFYRLRSKRKAPSC